MRRFQFRLERLLGLRAHREREWQAKLAEKIGICLRLSRQISDLAGEEARSFNMRFTGYGPLELHTLQTWELYLQRLGSEKAALEEELTVRMRERDQVQAEYLEASRQKKVLEKLKERKQAEYYAKQKAEEFKALDEINAGRGAKAG